MTQIDSTEDYGGRLTAICKEHIEFAEQALRVERYGSQNENAKVQCLKYITCINDSINEWKKGNDVDMQLNTISNLSKTLNKTCKGGQACMDAGYEDIMQRGVQLIKNLSKLATEAQSWRGRLKEAVSKWLFYMLLAMSGVFILYALGSAGSYHYVSKIQSELAGIKGYSDVSAHKHTTFPVRRTPLNSTDVTPYNSIHPPKVFDTSERRVVDYSPITAKHALVEHYDPAHSYFSHSASYIKDQNTGEVFEPKFETVRPEDVHSMFADATLQIIQAHKQRNRVYRKGDIRDVKIHARGAIIDVLESKIGDPLKSWETLRGDLAEVLELSDIGNLPHEEDINKALVSIKTPAAQHLYATRVKSYIVSSLISNPHPKSSMTDVHAMIQQSVTHIAESLTKDDFSATIEAVDLFIILREYYAKRANLAILVMLPAEANIKALAQIIDEALSGNRTALLSDEVGFFIDSVGTVNAIDSAIQEVGLAAARWLTWPLTKGQEAWDGALASMIGEENMNSRNRYRIEGMAMMKLYQLDPNVTVSLFTTLTSLIGLIASFLHYRSPKPDPNRRRD